MRPFVSIKNVPDRDLDFFVALGDTTYADSPALGPRAGFNDDVEDYIEFRIKNELVYTQLNSPSFYDEPIDDNMFALARKSTAFYATIDDHEVVNDFAGGAPPDTQTYAPECLSRPIKNIGGEIIGVDGSGWGVCFCDPGPGNDENPYSEGDPKYDPDWVKNCDRPFINETDLYKDALQAWHEYNPIRAELYGDTGDARTANKNKLYRYRTFGKDAAMFMLDTRSFRDEASTQFVYHEDRTMLGKAQLDEFLSDLADANDSGITWKIVLVPEPLQYLPDPAATSQDRFEGYAYERGVILDFIERQRIANVVFIAGDIHGTVVNNLTYETDRLERQRHSAAWEISAGPAAYSKGEGGLVGKGPGPMGSSSPIIGTGDGPIEDDGTYQEDVKDSDSVFQSRMDNLLRILNRPQAGLDDQGYTFPYRVPTQQWNSSVPATLLEGSYVAAHTYGWTEFEINADDQKLTVTTYGTNWYLPPESDEVTELLSRDPFIVSQFEVSPALCPTEDSRAHGEYCTNDNQCSSCICATEGINICAPNGGLTVGMHCKRDKECSSSICAEAGIRNECAPEGGLTESADCRRDLECESGICAEGGLPGPQGNTCAALGGLVGGERCVRDVECASGMCNLRLGVNRCEPFPNGERCAEDDECASGICNKAGLIDTCTPRLPEGGNCERDLECQSGYFCNEGLQDGGLLQGECNKENTLDGGEFCTDGRECIMRSGTCNKWLNNRCEPFPNGQRCGDDLECASEICNQAGIDQCASELGEGGSCKRDKECQSDYFCNVGLQDGGLLEGECNEKGKFSGGEFCTDGRECISGTCNKWLNNRCEPFPNGQRCGDDSECASEICNQAGIDQCANPGGFGDGCQRDRECSSNTCYNGNCANSGCRVNGSDCTNGNQCCSGNCLGGLFGGDEKCRL